MISPVTQLAALAKTQRSNSPASGHPNATDSHSPSGRAIRLPLGLGGGVESFRATETMAMRNSLNTERLPLRPARCSIHPTMRQIHSDRRNSNSPSMRRA